MFRYRLEGLVSMTLLRGDEPGGRHPRRRRLREVRVSVPALRQGFSLVHFSSHPEPFFFT